ARAWRGLQRLDQSGEGQAVGLAVVGEALPVGGPGGIDLEDVREAVADQLEHLLAVHGGSSFDVGLGGHEGSCARRLGRREAYRRRHFVRLCTSEAAGQSLCEDAAMRAALLRQIPGKLEIDEVEVSSPGPHEVLIRTVAAGLC